MDRKRELSSVDCAAVATELRRFSGAKVDKAYLYEDSLLRLRMRDFDRGRVELLIETDDPKRVHVTAPERVPEAPGRPPNFAMMLRNRIANADFAGVEQHGFDRVLTFRFEHPEGDTLVVAELFGDGNIAVTNADREVLGCLETVRLKSRTVAPGAVYEYPEARFNPLDADEDAFRERMEQSDADVVRTLATQLNLGGTWAEELCTRAGVPYNQPIDDTSDAEYDDLFHELGDLRDALANGRFDPRVWFEPVEGEESGDPEAETDAEEDGDGEPEAETDDEGKADGEGDEASEPARVRVDVTPFALAEYEHRYSESFDSFNDALDDYFTKFEPDPEAAGEGAGGSGGRGRDRPAFEDEIAKYERIVEQQEGAIESFDEEEAAERERAEALYAHYGTVDEVIEAVRQARSEDVPWDEIRERFEEGKDRGIPAAEAVVDLDGKERTVTLDLEGTRVPVDTTMGVEKNADRRYTEAKRIAEKKEGALEAIEDTREQLAAVEERREQWEARDADGGPGSDGADEAAGDRSAAAERDWLAETNLPVRRDEQWYERFRWFHTSDGFLVIGGRNADDNEALVKKYMETGDRFFHTQAPGAPATILKATGPSEPTREVDFPDASLEQAAQFAVSYSNAWKDGQFTADVYMVRPDQVSKTPESGEYVEKGSFVVRGDRTYFEDTAVGVAVGVQVDPQTRVVGGPPAAIEPRTVTSVRLEPGQYAQNDIAKLIYRRLRERFADQAFVRKVASPDLIQECCPAGGSRIVDE